MKFMTQLQVKKEVISFSNGNIIKADPNIILGFIVSKLYLLLIN